MANCVFPAQAVPHGGKKRDKNNNPIIMSEALDGPDGNDMLIEDNLQEGETRNLLRPQNKIAINDFELVKVIGRGSFGKVYLVRRNGTNNFYAMKKLRKDIVAKRNLFIKTQGKYFNHSHMICVLAPS